LNLRPLGYESGGLVPSVPSGAVSCRPVRSSCRRAPSRAAEVRVVRLQMVCTIASKVTKLPETPCHGTADVEGRGVRRRRGAGRRRAHRRPPSWLGACALSFGSPRGHRGGSGESRSLISLPYVPVPAPASCKDGGWNVLDHRLPACLCQGREPRAQLNPYAGDSAGRAWSWTCASLRCSFSTSRCGMCTCSSAG